jgi:hypothetical protein
MPRFFLQWAENRILILNFIIVCASSSAPRVYELIEAAQQRGWDVCRILTPHARKFVDAIRGLLAMTCF